MIRNKYQSDQTIKVLGLNRVAEKIFFKDAAVDELIKFLIQTNYSYYNIREKSNSAGKFKYKLTKSEILEISSDYYNFSVFESLAEADNRLILQGDIEIDKDFIMRASLSTIKNISNRIAMQEPEYNIYNYDLKEQKEPNIKGLSKVIDYVSRHNLIGMVVEFSLYEIPVGINRENIIIWELRNY